MFSLKIKTTKAEVGINTTPAKLDILNTTPKMRMKQKQADMTIDIKYPKIKIDQTEAFAEVGNKTIFRLMDDFVLEAYEKCIKAIGDIAKEGTRILKAGNNRAEAVKQIMSEKVFDSCDINIAALPSEGPDISAEEGSVDIQWKINMPEVKWDLNPRPKISAEPHSVEIYMQKYPSIDIEVIENKQNGNYVNRIV